MSFENIHRVYFIGAGGIGMSALARYFNSLGKKVAGYDRTATTLTSQLISEGIDIHFTDEKNIPAEFNKSEDTLVVYTPAVPQDHPELRYFRENGYRVLKRSETLGLITKEMKGIAVAGTHGKTTVSTMIAHLMKNSAVGCNAFLGGISKNFETNLVLSENAEYVVVEADEFDRSFLTLNPNIAIVTSIDTDHLDIYEDRSDLYSAFGEFIDRIDPDGTLLFKKEIEKTADLEMPEKTYYYSVSEKADFYAENIRVKNGKHLFDLIGPSFIIKDMVPGVPGRFNIENSVAACAAAFIAGVNEAELKQALSSFMGSKRRFDYIINNEEITYIDDYAHHPEELKACIGAVRELFPNRTITGIFQPHLYSRTRDLADDFATSLELLDELILLEIYPAREEPIDGIDSAFLFNKINIADKILCDKSNLISILSGKKPDVLLTMGAGDIDKFVEPIKELLNKTISN